MSGKKIGNEREKVREREKDKGGETERQRRHKKGGVEELREGVCPKNDPCPCACVQGGRWCPSSDFDLSSVKVGRGESCHSVSVHLSFFKLPVVRTRAAEPSPEVPPSAGIAQGPVRAGWGRADPRDGLDTCLWAEPLGRLPSSGGIASSQLLTAKLAPACFALLLNWQRLHSFDRNVLCENVNPTDKQTNIWVGTRFLFHCVL